MNMNLNGFKESLMSILNKTVSEIEELQKEFEDPFYEKQYQNQGEYEKFLDQRELEELLLQMKTMLARLTK
jgi:hypothetical protein